MAKRSTRSLAAEAEFRARVEELGGVCLYEKWTSVDDGHLVRCAEGHEGTADLTHLRAGRGICPGCGRAAHFQKVAGRSEQEFRDRIEDLGGMCLFIDWQGVHKKHLVLCPEGHECYPYPKHVQEGIGICVECSRSGRGSEVFAERDFRARVEDVGGTCLYKSWTGSSRPHKVRCSEGHVCSPRPSGVRRGGGLCKVCAGRDPKTAEANFRVRVEELGGVCLYGKWQGSLKPHRVRCKYGHESSPYPTNLQRGEGICHQCNGMLWDVIYLIEDPESAIVKFGVTSGDARPRLRTHRKSGFTVVYYTETVTDAKEIEDAIKSALKLAGEKPVRGREYFPSHCLALISEVLRSYL